MNFTLLDWSAIVAYLGITLFLGLYFRSRSGKSVDDYFVSGRNVSWWLAGTSMVATTFAADTPLVVTGLVYTQGVAGNWLWWCFVASGMLTRGQLRWNYTAILPDVYIPKGSERTLDVRRWTEMPRGGHFAALEVPDLYARDVSEFFHSPMAVAAEPTRGTSDVHPAL